MLQAPGWRAPACADPQTCEITACPSHHAGAAGHWPIQGTMRLMHMHNPLGPSMAFLDGEQQVTLARRTDFQT